MRPWFRATLLVLLAGLFSQHALAFDFSVKARAEAGLDAATRQFLNDLPSVWKPQILEILDGALNRVDRSVEGYLAAVDKLVSKKIAELTCAEAAMAKTTVDEIRRIFPWVGQQHPIEDLRRKMADDKQRINGNRIPKDVRTIYSEQARAAGVVACQTAFVDVANAESIDILEEVRSHWFVWNRVVATGCSPVSNCAAALRDHVTAGLAASDPRDVSDELRRRLDGYKPPKAPGFFEGFDTRRFEASLRELTAIEDTFLAAKAVREAAGAAAFTEAQGKINEAASLAEKWAGPIAGVPKRMGSSLLRGIGGPQLCQAFFQQLNPTPELTFAANRIAEARDLLQKSQDLVPELFQDVDGEHRRANTVADRVGALLNHCG